MGAAAQSALVDPKRPRAPIKSKATERMTASCLQLARSVEYRRRASSIIGLKLWGLQIIFTFSKSSLGENLAERGVSIRFQNISRVLISNQGIPYANVTMRPTRSDLSIFTAAKGAERQSDRFSNAALLLTIDESPIRAARRNSHFGRI